MFKMFALSYSFMRSIKSCENSRILALNIVYVFEHMFSHISYSVIRIRVIIKVRLFICIAQELEVVSQFALPK